MLMQETGAGVGAIVTILSALAIITMVLWLFLPFAIFGVKGLLTNILDEQRRTTSAVSALNRDVREIAQQALQEPRRHRELPDH